MDRTTKEIEKEKKNLGRGINNTLMQNPNLPTEIDREIVNYLKYHTIEGYQKAYKTLKPYVGHEKALATVFCFFIWDAGRSNNQLQIGDDWVQIIKNTKPFLFGNDYKYEVYIEFQFGPLKINRHVGEFSRYYVGLGMDTADAATIFMKIIGMPQSSLIQFETWDEMEEVTI